LTKTSIKTIASIKKGENTTKPKTVDKDKHQNDNIHQKTETNEAKNGGQRQASYRQHTSNQRKTNEVKNAWLRQHQNDNIN
jgi:hypothetical protein